MMVRERFDVKAGCAAVLLLAVLIALCIAIYDDLASIGIAHSIGVEIIIGSTTLLLGMSAVAFLAPRLPRWLSILLQIGILIDIIGTGVAGYFLETHVQMAFLGVALLAWLLRISWRFLAPRRPATV